MSKSRPKSRPPKPAPNSRCAKADAKTGGPRSFVPRVPDRPLTDDELLFYKPLTTSEWAELSTHADVYFENVRRILDRARAVRRASTLMLVPNGGAS